MKKNDDIILEITDLTGGGDGIAKADDGRIVFIPNTAVGDTVLAHIIKVKPRYALAKLVEIIKPSPHRIESDCSIYERCGGCVFRHISYERECEIKYNQVKNSINRIGGIDIEPNAIIKGEFQNNYRNKAQYPIGTDKNGKIICGFYSGRSHRVVPLTSCCLQPQIFEGIIEVFCDWANENNLTAYSEETGKGLLRHLYIRYAEVTNQIMVVVVINGKTLPCANKLAERFEERFGEAFKSFQININTKDTNVILSDKCQRIFGEDYVYDILCGVKIRLSPLSFYQVNRNMAEKLYSKAREYADPQDKFILDLYCGAGTIGLSMARKAKKIIGVEIVPEAIEDAKFNAKENGIDNCEFICGDASFAAKNLKNRGINPDVVILDPPRKGCDEEVIKIVANDFKPERVVYVSCNDATLARDCALFKELGYEAKKLTPVDMFPRTGHVEVVALLNRESPKDMKQAFLKNTELLADTFGITPLLYGSLGLEYLTNENLNADDVDILIPQLFLKERWLELKGILEKNGYVLIDEREHTFEKEQIHYSYAQIEELESFAGIKMSDIRTVASENVNFKLLSLQQYLKVYSASAKDGYRIEARGKKDFEKIAFIKDRLQTSEHICDTL